MKKRTIKKIFFISIVPILLCYYFILTPQIALADQASISLSPISGGPYKTGDRFSVNIWTKTGGANIDTIRASLSFPATILEAESVTLGSVYTAPSGGNYIDNINGVIYWGAGAYGGNTTDTTFATIRFKTKISGNANVSFNTNSLMLSAGQAVPFLTSGGTYIAEDIVPKETTTTPQASPQPIASPNQEENTLQSIPNISNTITNVSEKGTTVVFEGKSNIESSEIKFETEGGLINSSIYADENGNWNWETPAGLAPGKYKIKITAIHPEDSSITAEISQDFEIIITEALEALFDVILGVNKSTKKIKAGDSLSVNVKLLNFGESITDESITNVSLVYIIENRNKQEIFRISESRAVVGRESSFNKIIPTPAKLKAGQYSISAQMSYGKTQEASSSDMFEITNPSYAYKLTTPVLILLLLIIIGLILIWRKKIK